MKYIMVGTTALLTLLISPVIQAQPGPGGTGPGPGCCGRGMGLARLHERLDLSADQEKQMQRLQLDHQKKMQQIRSKVEEAKLDLKGLFLVDTPDRAAIEKAMKAITDLRHQQQVTWVDHWFAVNAILTSSQREVWKEIGERAPRPTARCEGCGRHRWHGGWDH